MYVLFCSGMLNGTIKYCGRWNTTEMAMTGGKLMMLYYCNNYGRWKSHHVDIAQMLYRTC